MANGTSKNVGLGKFWQDLEISEAFLTSLEISFLHGLYLLFLSLESRILPFATPIIIQLLIHPTTTNQQTFFLKFCFVCLFVVVVVVVDVQLQSLVVFGT